MKKIIKYLRKIIPHNSPLRLWYTRIIQLIAYINKPVDVSNIKLIGVTGTDGKTTTVEMIAHILRVNGIKYISSSSLEIKKNGVKLEASKRTTPSLFTLKRLLKQASLENIDIVIIEVSSHALAQWRVLGVKFDATILTNLTHEHLNFHKTIERYAAAKKLLFTKHLKKDGVAILNKDDTYGSKWLNELNCTTIPYMQPEASTSARGVSFVYNNKHYSMPMLGTYNTANALAAALAVASQVSNIDVKSALSSMSTFTGISGRMQIIPIPKSTTKPDLIVIVDFALTQKAMASTLSTARELAGEASKVFVVFGATGGQHDTSVRSGLTEAVSAGADVAIVTDDEPYDSNPANIRSKLVKFIEDANKKYNNVTVVHNVADRRVAIQQALSDAEYRDVVVVSGMGHYTSRTVNGEELPWNDAQVITEELAKL
ncbi:MAG: UDP-N-acetylmuramyl-tripeptide synthetase [Candidatus Pacebacteria bacterium]|nr:UDP-N-acetylmuramyl-tripeptide synthetase [Candidatus Paceibacterota bacterium]